MTKNFCFVEKILAWTGGILKGRISFQKNLDSRLVLLKNIITFDKFVTNNCVHYSHNLKITIKSGCHRMSINFNKTNTNETNIMGHFFPYPFYPFLSNAQIMGFLKITYLKLTKYINQLKQK